MPPTASRTAESRRFAHEVAERVFRVAFEDGRSNYGRFTTDPLRGSTVRVMFSSTAYYDLPLHLTPQSDFYLVIRGTYGTAQTPTIEAVYLHERAHPVDEPQQAMIYPFHVNKRWVLTDEQKRQLGYDKWWKAALEL